MGKDIKLRGGSWYNNPADARCAVRDGHLPGGRNGYLGFHFCKKVAASHVFRGGSWHDAAWFCRSAYHYRLRPGFRGHFLGFRLVTKGDKNEK
jgi:formylglycine-generating enzyme required for sulfatase activity